MVRVLSMRVMALLLDCFCRKLNAGLQDLPSAAVMGAAYDSFKGNGPVFVVDRADRFGEIATTGQFHLDRVHARCGFP